MRKPIRSSPNCELLLVALVGWLDVLGFGRDADLLAAGNANAADDVLVQR
jgi:hypothetical protein